MSRLRRLCKRLHDWWTADLSNPETYTRERSPITDGFDIGAYEHKPLLMEGRGDKPIRGKPLLCRIENPDGSPDKEWPKPGCEKCGAPVTDRTAEYTEYDCGSRMCWRHGRRGVLYPGPRCKEKSDG